MEIVKEFGIEPTLLVAQVVNFLVILYILKRFLYKPVLAMLAKRKSEIAQGILDAENAHKLLEKTQEEEKKVLQKAQAQAKALLEDAKKQAQEIAKEAEQDLKKRTALMLAETKSQIAQEAQEAEGRILKNVTKISIQILQQSLSGLVSTRAQQEILEKTLKEIEKKAN